MQDKLYYVYILKCGDGTLYTGITNEIERRISAHNEGKGAKYTKGRLPVSLAYSEALETKSVALKREIQIKKMNKARKVKLIEGILVK